MKIGMNVLLWTAAANEEHLGLLEEIKAWGYDGVELPMFAPDCSPWPALSAKLDELELGRTVVTVVPPDANPIAEDPATRAAGVAQLKASVDSCVAVGSDLLIGPLYAPCGELVGRAATPDEWAWGVEGMNEVAEYAGDARVTLAIEPLNRFESYFITSGAEAADFVDEVDHPNLKMMLDTFHANIEEKDPIGAIRAAGDRLVHFHVSENDRSTPGEGHIPFPQVFAALHEIGYDGWLTVEAFGRVMPEVAAATCIWRDMMPCEEHLARAAHQLISEGW